VTEEQRSFVIYRMNHWYVVYTKPRWEKKISKLLDEKGIKNYCPLKKVYRQWSDRKKIILEPLFKGYVFVNIAEEDKWELKKIEGILNYVYWLGKPARVRQEEIEIIQKFLNDFEGVEVVEKNLSLNDNVFINQGILMNHNGKVIEIIGNKAKVIIESLGLQLIAVFDKKHLNLT